MKIGITERGDAGLDLSWRNKLHTVDGVILITKNLTQPFMDCIRQLYANGYPFLVHCTCTGWGSTPMEPKVPEYDRQLDALNQLIQSGTPKDRFVLRIDPIFPNKAGLFRLNNVVTYAIQAGLLPDLRVRISVYDEYRHVKKRLHNAGLLPLYGETQRYAPRNMMQDVQSVLNELHDKYGVMFETCAEPALNGPAIVRQGCISEKDLKILGLPAPQAGVNPQNRAGCLCLSCKTELLTQKHRCPHQCLYCYWQD